jgi:hypothetical protein
MKLSFVFNKNLTIHAYSSAHEHFNKSIPTKRG